MKNLKFYMMATLIGIATIMTAYQQGSLHADAAAAPAKIAVVDVTKVIKNCQKFKTWQEEKQKEVQQIEAVFKTMQDELAALNENLKIRTPGSEDHRKLAKEFIEKKTTLQAKDAAYKEIWESEKEQWTEQLYQELLSVIDTVATKKGFDIIIANEELNLKDPMRPDIMQTIVTKKLLYHNSKYDITEEILAALDAKN
ncbi:MAG: OmpH family outer membrane protein [Phycisphaerae bacterium]|nr:OmpH family outer membrane protein [Phycisphaerae bacterium]